MAWNESGSIILAYRPVTEMLCLFPEPMALSRNAIIKFLGLITIFDFLKIQLYPFSKLKDPQIIRSKYYFVLLCESERAKSLYTRISIFF